MAVRDLSGMRSFVYGLLRLTNPIVRLFGIGGEPTASDVPVTIVVPLHPKDAPVAAHAIRYARKNIRHPVKEVVVVAKPGPAIAELCDTSRCRLVDEADVLPVSTDELRRRLAAHGYGYWTWIFQQLLKLGADEFVETEAMLVLDADTLLLRPTVFLRGDCLYQQFSHERNPMYFKTYRALVGMPPVYRFSFVTHHMFAEMRVLKALRTRIEETCGRPWVDAIIDRAAPELWTEAEREAHPFNFFSEYETYGNFAPPFYEETKHAYFFNFAASDFEEGADIDAYVEKIPKLFRWASFHHYVTGDGHPDQLDRPEA